MLSEIILKTTFPALSFSNLQWFDETMSALKVLDQKAYFITTISLVKLFKRHCFCYFYTTNEVKFHFFNTIEWPSICWLRGL